MSHKTTSISLGASFLFFFLAAHLKTSLKPSQFFPNGFNDILIISSSLRELSKHSQTTSITNLSLGFFFIERKKSSSPPSLHPHASLLYCTNGYKGLRMYIWKGKKADSSALNIYYKELPPHLTRNWDKACKRVLTYVFVFGTFAYTFNDLHSDRTP